MHKKEEVEAMLGAGDLGPIETYLEVIATDRHLPAVAIGMCLLRMEEAAPPVPSSPGLRTASRCPMMKPTCCLRSVHSGRRARCAVCKDLLRLLRRPEAELEDLLGDGLTQDMARIVTGVFDGDGEGSLEPRYGSVGQSIRSQPDVECGGLPRLEQGIERRRMRGLLEQFYWKKLAEDQDHAWHAWQQAIALLGFRDLASLVRNRRGIEGRI